MPQIEMGIRRIAEQIVRSAGDRTGFFPVNRESEQPGGNDPDPREQYGGTWGNHPDYPVSDWQYEVANGDTRLGYWDWVDAFKTDRAEELRSQ